MFKIPEKIKIGFVDYRIEEINRLSGEKTVIGEHFEEHACIQLAQHLSPSTKAKVLIHECLHAVMAQYGVCVDEEERLIGQLSTGITEIIDQIVEFNQDEKEPKYGRLLIHGICEVDRILTPLLDNDSKRKIMDTELGEPVITKEEDPHGFCHMVKHTERLARLLKEQLDKRQKVYDVASTLTDPGYTKQDDISISELARQGWKNYERKRWKEMDDKFQRECHENAVDIFFPDLSKTEKKEMVDKLMEDGISCFAWIGSTKREGEK